MHCIFAPSPQRGGSTPFAACSGARLTSSPCCLISRPRQLVIGLGVCLDRYGIKHRLTQSAEEYHASTIIHPGTNFLDYDCETAASYDGHHKGTTSVLGYSEEYREFQLSQTVQFQLSLEEQNPPPPMTLDAVVERLQLLQRNATHEDNARLRQIIGLPACV